MPQISRSTFHVPRFTFHVPRFTFHISRLVFYILLLATSLLLLPTPLAAQSPSTSYWQYSTASRLQLINLADVNQDGVDELLVADENGQVSLVNANGRAIWSYETLEQVFVMSALNVDGTDEPDLEVVLGTRQNLILLSASGELIWNIPISVVSVPPAILTSGGEEAAEAWIAQYVNPPVVITSIEDENGRFDILLLFQAGQLHRYNGAGQLIWEYGRNNNPSFDAHPQMAVADLDQNGTADIALSFFNTSRFSELIVLNGNGIPRWNTSQSFSRRVTTLTLLPDPASAQRLIAVGSTSGEINLYQPDGTKVWLRTPTNKTITALTAVQLPSGPALAAGTDVGVLIVYSPEGRRLWARQMSANADQRILSLHATTYTPSESQPTLSLALQSNGPGSTTTDVYLLGNDGQILDTFPGVDTNGLTRLIDINHDEKSEMLLARFATLELLGLGSGSTETARDWDWSLFASPLSYLVADFEQDGTEEVLIGADDGRLHRLDNNSFGYPQWIQKATGRFTHLALLPAGATGTPKVVAVRNNTIFSPNSDNVYESWVELRQPSGERIWEQNIPTEITSLYVGDINNRGEAEIVVGTRTGEIIAFASTGTTLWQTEPITYPIEHLLTIRGIYSQSPELLAVTSNEIYKIPNNLIPNAIATYTSPIHAIYPLNQPGHELATAILVFLQDGTLSRLAWRGIELPAWELSLPGTPLTTLFIRNNIEEAFEEQNPSESFLVASNQERLTSFSVRNNQAESLWELQNIKEITSLDWVDLDSDTLPELVVGSANGQISIYSHRLDAESSLTVSGPITAITTLLRKSEQRADLLIITGNGGVHLFRTQDNRPPLLTQPNIDVAPGQYSFSVNALDVEQDVVTIRLELYDPLSQQWLVQPQERQINGDGSSVWVVLNPPAVADGVHYRFSYDDGFHQGYLTPPPGPLPVLVPEQTVIPTLSIGLLTVSGVTLMILVARQVQSPAASARRLYRQLKEYPEETLETLEKQYILTKGSPDFLLNLSRQARQRADFLIANLADGLFLLADRPHAALPIISGALDDAYHLTPSWRNIHRWRKIHKVGHALLEAPTITELSLLRPQLVGLLAELESKTDWSPVLDALLPILTNLRDSERVELAEDRLVYLNEAAVLLNQIRHQLPEFSATIERTLVTAVLNRWSGLVSAEVADLRGRAELAITLKTRQLVPTPQTDVALEIRNNGRAPAETIVVTLDNNPAYTILTPRQEIALLPPGRTRQVQFTIKPNGNDRFRLALTVTFSDRTQQNKSFVFADMVHLLQPVREFNPIANPYLPGTALRQNSNLFFGRDELFQFITENAGRLSQRSVLILIGQRRTGKTSMLLRLGQHLPPHLLPVYIDCQSLGVTPGMPSLLYDLAWHIADALAARDIQVTVPETAEWQADPNGRFQRHFLPQVHQVLPANTTLLLVFDEFEAFENLVNDGILPSTFFTYMRHLMQHSSGLSFVFVGTRRLEEMSADYWSVLFNIALYKKIGYLSEQAASRLIQEPVAPNLIYDDLAMDKILRVTAGHPYFLQLVCYTLVQQANSQKNGYVTISDVNAALDEMLRLGEAHFAYLWQRSSQVERALLTAVSHLMDNTLPFHPEQLMEYLKPYDIHLDAAEVTTAISHLVERDILQEVHEGPITLYELKVTLVGLWIARHKSLTKLYSSNGEERKGTTLKRKV